MKTIHFVRYKYSVHGGAEKYLSRITQELGRREISYEILSTNDYDTHTHTIEIPKWFPRFLKILRFDNAITAFKDERRAFIFSLERISHPTIYRAGDGVHRAWLQIRSRHRVLNRFSWIFKPLNWIYLHLEKECFRNAEAIIANSHRGKEEIIRHYGIPEEKIHVIYNGVTHKPYDSEASRKILEEEFGVRNDLPIILFVGSGFERKGVLHLLELLSNLKELDFHAFIVGKEKRIRLYESIAKTLGLADKVTFTGIRKDVEYFYAAADIFLFPTLYEPFSNACLEAMSYGCTLVTTKQNGVSEIVPTPELLMDFPGDPTVLIHIKKLLQSPSFLREIQQLHQQAVTKMSIEQNVTQTLDLIQSIMHEHTDSSS